MYEVERYVNVNIRGTAILLDLLANNEHHIQKVVSIFSLMGKEIFLKLWGLSKRKK